MEIVGFAGRHAEDFRRLNEIWILQHFQLEEKDRRQLLDPVGEIIDPGGFIFVAEHEGAMVGCCAMLRMDDGGFELVKMTVAEDVRGQGVGRMLIDACLDRAKEEGASRLYLETNSALAPALHLYRVMGFEDCAPRESEYERCDVWMERRFGPDTP